MDFDALNNSGNIKIRFFMFTVFTAKIYFQHTGLTKNNLVIERKNKKDEIHISNDKTDKQSIVSMMSGLPILSAIDVKDLYLDFYMGKQNDAFFTTMLTCGVKVMLYSALAFVKTYYNADINESFNAMYNENAFKLDGFGIITSSLADIISSVIGIFKKAVAKKQKNENKLNKRRAL